MIEYVDSILVTPTMRDNRTNQIVQEERMDPSVINLSNVHTITDCTGFFFFRTHMPIVGITYLNAQVTLYYQDDYARILGLLKKYKILQEKNNNLTRFN